ncbi:hypothetical protein [Microbacterium sp. GXS0129]|uniref:hypothetical protein n=1 Tax=Microbacterium sp. GXS0129 TaxID=3377836 RepID=UPI00383B7267
MMRIRELGDGKTLAPGESFEYLRVPAPGEKKLTVWYRLDDEPEQRGFMVAL